MHKAVGVRIVGTSIEEILFREPGMSSSLDKCKRYLEGGVTALWDLFIFFIIPSFSVELSLSIRGRPSIIFAVYAELHPKSFGLVIHYIMYYSRSFVSLPIIALLSSTALAVPHGNLMTRQGRADNHTLNRERADAVKASFVYAWNGYKQ